MKVPLSYFLKHRELAKGVLLADDFFFGELFAIGKFEPLFEEGDKAGHIIKISQAISKANSDPNSRYAKEYQAIERDDVYLFRKGMLVKEKIIMIDIIPTKELDISSKFYKRLMLDLPHTYYSPSKNGLLSEVLQEISMYSYISLSDVFNPLTRERIISYGDIIDQDFINKNNAEINVITKPLDMSKIRDELTTGEVVLYQDVYGYDGRLIAKKDMPLSDFEEDNNESIQNVIKGSPNIYVAHYPLMEGVFFIGISSNVSMYLKKLLYTQGIKFIGEADDFDSATAMLEEFNIMPHIFVIGGSFDRDKFNSFKMRDRGANYTKEEVYIYLTAGPDNDTITSAQQSGVHLVLDSKHFNKNDFIQTIRLYME